MTCHHYEMQMKQAMNRYIYIYIYIGNEGVKHNIKFEEQKNEIIKFCWNRSRLKNEALKLSSAFLKDLKMVH